MNALNRVIIVAAALVVLAGAIITVLVATETSEPDIVFSGWFESQLEEVADSDGGDVAAIITASITIALVMIILLFLELAYKRRPILFLLSSTDHGIATIDRNSICDLAESTALTSHNVRDVMCKVGKQGPDLMMVSCKVSLALGTNMPEVTAELQSKIKESIEELTGLTVLQVNVKSKYESGRNKHMALR